MFRAIGRLFSKKSQELEAPLISPEEQAAFEKGREIARTQIAKIEQFLKWRFEQIRNGYLDVIQRQLDSARQQEEYSPILVARMEYSLYLDHVKEAKGKLKTEVHSHFQEWAELNQTMAIEDLMEKWLDETLTDKFSELSLAGLKILTDNAEILKTADDNWRRNFPELAAALPLH